MIRALPLTQKALQLLALAFAAEKVRFLLAGAWNTLVGYLIFVGVHIVYGTKLGTVGTIIVSYVIALPAAFIVQRLFVFRTRGIWIKQFIRFALANSTVVVANSIFLPIAITTTRADPLLLQAIFLVISAATSYLAHKHYSFARRP
jgi:putative flippase GtrA